MEAYREEMSPEMMGHAEASFNEDPNAVIYRKLRRHFDGKIVRKDLTLSLIHIYCVPNCWVFWKRTPP